MLRIPSRTCGRCRSAFKSSDEGASAAFGQGTAGHDVGGATEGGRDALQHEHQCAGALHDHQAAPGAGVEQPLAESVADAGGRGACWRSDADGVRDGAHLGEGRSHAAESLEELREHPPWAQLGAEEYGGCSGSFELHEVGFDEREADTASDRLGRTRWINTGGATGDGDVAIQEGPHDELGGSSSIGDLERGRQHHSSTGQCERGPLLRGSSGEAGLPSRHLQGMGEESPGRVHSPWVPDERAGEDPPAPGVSIGGEQLQRGRGERIVMATPTPASERGRGRPSKRKRAGWGGLRPAQAQVATTPETQARDMARCKEELQQLRTQLRRKESDGVQAARCDFSEEVRLLREECSVATKVAGAAKHARSKADKAAAEALAAKVGLEKELVALQTKARDQMQRIDELVKEQGSLRLRLAVKQRMVDARDAKLDAATKHSATQVEDFATKLEAAEEVSKARLTTIRSVAGRLGGRPVVNRGAEELEECSDSAASSCHQRMVARVLVQLGVCGEDDAVSPDALVKALRQGGWMPTLWESEVMWEWRMDWMECVSEELQTIWTPEHTWKLRDKLCVSMDKLDEMRYSFSHNRVGKQLVPRPWVINPWTGARVNFPQPIRPRNGINGWHKLVKLSIERWGLTMDAAGRVAQRSFKATVQKQVQRDTARDILSPSTVDEPLTIVLGADGTGVGKRGIMHVGVSVAPSYKLGIAQQNERNLNTVATSVTDDHWGGLNETLCAGFYTGAVDELPPTCIAAEVDAINAHACLDLTTPARVAGCFDLVAARGIRGGSARCACHTAATTAEERFSVPDLDGVESWAEAVPCLAKQPLLTNEEMRDDSHTPPRSWDFEADGPWKCKRPGCAVVFASHAEFITYRDDFLAAKADKTPEGKKRKTARAAAHAKLHITGQVECEPPLLSLDMEDIIIDPLHALMLNLPKVIWKYTFGDRMTNTQRELVAEYLTYVGCPLDVRAKCDGRDANRKWFTGEIFAKFVEGDDSGHCPGLVSNINAILDIIYVKYPAPLADPSTPAAPAPVTQAKTAPATAKPTNMTKRNGGGGAKIRQGGFSVAAAPVTVNPVATAPTSAASVAAPATSSAATPDAPSTIVDSELDARFRARYQSHMDSAKLAHNAWRALGELYVEWRTTWTSRTTAYTQTRALQFAKLAAKLSITMKAASLGKHKSWYTYLVAWVVPRQMAARGDVWAFSTSPIEQRGARLKKIVRSVISWRPPCDGYIAAAGPVLKGGSAPKAWVGRRKYESCAMLQLLRACVAQEEGWAAPAIHEASSSEPALSVSELRMQRTGRTTLIKNEQGKGLRLPKLLAEIVDLT